MKMEQPNRKSHEEHISPQQDNTQSEVLPAQKPTFPNRKCGDSQWDKSRWHRSGWSPNDHRSDKWKEPAEWRNKRRYILRRAIRYFTLVGILVMGGMAVASFLITRFFGGTTHTAALVWLTGCSLSIALPMMAIAVAMRGYRGFATPLANVMAAADAVADGDLTARVPEPQQGRSNGEIGRLAKSFNHMATELERSDEQRRNLTADVAHELRTPLHIIQGNLEGILDGVYEATPDHINATLEETRSLARLVDDLRTLSLAEAGELPLVFEEVDIADLLADIETSFQGEAEAQNIQFECTVEQSDQPMVVHGDPGRLDQVLGNLIVNALRHTSAGDQVEVSVFPEESQAVIEIRDSGEGIAAADLPYIFDRFWRGDRARSHGDGSGGGLGLAIVRQLVNAHNGTITAESVQGEGSLFRVKLPLIMNEAERVRV